MIGQGLVEMCSSVWIGLSTELNECGLTHDGGAGGAEDQVVWVGVVCYVFSQFSVGTSQLSSLLRVPTPLEQKACMEACVGEDLRLGP